MCKHFLSSKNSPIWAVYSAGMMLNMFVQVSSTVENAPYFHHITYDHIKDGVVLYIDAVVGVLPVPF